MKIQSLCDIYHLFYKTPNPPSQKITENPKLIHKSVMFFLRRRKTEDGRRKLGNRGDAENAELRGDVGIFDYFGFVVLFDCEKMVLFNLLFSK